VTRYPANHVLGAQRNGVNNTRMELAKVDQVTGPLRDTNYPVYSDSLLNWYQGQGVASVRQTFTWEAVQSGLGAAHPVPAYADYWDDLVAGPKGVVKRLLARGIHVTLALWQGNPATSATDITYGGKGFTPQDFGDFWGGFATAINVATGNDQRVSFDLINEPHVSTGGLDVGISLDQWGDRAQAAINAIRATGATNTIFWSGMTWTAAYDFLNNMSADKFLTLKDPLNNLAVTVHDYSGTTNPVLSGTATPTSTAVSDACKDLIDWARKHGIKVQIGEVAVDAGHPHGTFTLGHDQWADWQQFCLANDDVIVGWHWWGNSEAGAWNDQDSGGAQGWGLTLDNGANPTVYRDLIGDSFRAPFLVLRDNTADPGTGPNTTTATGWESPDIWVRRHPDGVPIEEPIIGGAPATVYVRITNRGTGSYPGGAGTDAVQLFWAKAQAGLSWPAPWNGSNGPLQGGVVAAPQPVAPPPTTITAGADTVLAFAWPATPDPANYVNDPGHFCLLAVITKNPTAVTPPPNPFDGFTGPDLNANVLRFSHVAWHNIHVLPAQPHMHRLGNLVVANHTDGDVRVQVAFEVLDDRAQAAESAGRITLAPSGVALERIREFGDPENLDEIGEGTFRVVDPATGIVGLYLRPGDGLDFGLELAADEDASGYALRATQYTIDGDERTPIGGQTFIAGKVDGWTA
jgi:endoglucanase